jgi:hypothetical protein
MRGVSIVLAVTGMVGASRSADAIERLLPEGSSAAPVLDAEQSVLFVRRELQVVGVPRPR